MLKFLSSWVPKCPSSAQVPKCLSVQVHKCFECLRALGMPLECLWGAHFFSLWEPQCPSAVRMPLECFWSSQFPLECSTSKKKSATLQQNLAKNFSGYKFYMTLLAVSFLGNKICKFCLVLPATCNQSFKRISKTFLKYFAKFQKTKYNGVRSSLLSKIVVLIVIYSL